MPRVTPFGFATIVAMIVPILINGARIAHTSEEPMTLDDQPLFRLTAGPADGRPVLLLHGAKFDATTWQTLGTIEVLANAGLRVIAVDLPGFGKSPAHSIDPATFGLKLLAHLKIERPVVVSPSMSGGISLPMIQHHPDRVAAFVPIAPVGSVEYGQKLAENPVPTLVVWGEKDDLFPPSQAGTLAAGFKNAEVLILPEARHPAYLDQPEMFHDALLKFIAGLRD